VAAQARGRKRASSERAVVPAALQLRSTGRDVLGAAPSIPAMRMSIPCLT